jgi:hypothetical protein
MRRPHFLRETGDCTDERRCGVAGALGVVLLGDGRAEESHDPVAGELVHRPAKSTHALRQDLDETAHHPGPDLGIDVLLKVHGA